MMKEEKEEEKTVCSQRKATISRWRKAAPALGGRIWDLGPGAHSSHCYFTRLNLKKMGHLIFPSNITRNSSAPCAKSIFQFLWGILEGRTIRARPSRSFLINCQNGTFLICAWNLKNFRVKCLHLRCYASAIVWLYPKNVSGSVHLLPSAYMRG